VTTTNTKTIKSSGGDYTSLSSWEAGRQADLVAGDLIEVAECYDLGAADTTKVVIDGWTTGASNYIKITVPSAQRHSGTRNSSKYRLVGTGAFDAMLQIREDFVRVDGLQIKNTSPYSTPAVLCLNLGAGGDIRFTDCLVYDTSTSTQNGFKCQNCNSTCTVTFINCAAFACSGDGFNADAGTIRFYNCVSVNNGGYGIRTNFNTLTTKNCYSGGNTSADYFTSGSHAHTTSYSEDGTGSTSTAAFSTSSGAYFTNVTSGSENLHIGASSSLKDAGTSLAGWDHPSGDVDVDGDARSGTWDVGYDEYVSAGATTVPYLTLLGVGS